MMEIRLKLVNLLVINYGWMTFKTVGLINAEVNFENVFVNTHCSTKQLLLSFPIVFYFF